MKLEKMNKDLNLDQQKAVYTKEKNILVSAPAGSGKTKILVNRMMEHLLNDGYEVDDFLVVTFTAAAALEMKQRLSKEIDKHEELKAQKVKLPYAYITNFHGFCSTLLKKYGSLVGVPSHFEILADSTLVKNEAYTICLEKWMEDQKFKDFLSLYFSGTDLSGFFSQLMNLVESLHVIENRETYLEDVYQSCYDNCEEDNWAVVKLIQAHLLECLEESQINYERLCQVANDMGIEDFFERPEKQGKASAQALIPYEAYEMYLEHLKNSFTVQYISYETLMSQCNYKIPKAYSISWKDTNYPDGKCAERKNFDNLKKKITQPFTDAYKKLYTPDNKELLERSKKYLEMFLGKGGLVEQFNQTFSELKLRNSYLDFNDLEDYTIQLLDPSLPIASLLKSQLKEVMIDEYQDTNGVQEKIINLITSNSSINKFMVGDIKQSIYRFRRADPKLFNHKYNSYEVFDDQLPEGKDVRIDLHYNYRSNKIVLDSINYIFNMIMDEKIGDVRYLEDANHQLNYDFYRKGDLEDKYNNETRFDTELLLYDKNGDNSEVSLTNEELEANLVAQRILKLVKEESIDTFSKQARSIDFKDIAILTRTAYSLVTFKKVFDQYGIPCHIILSNGYYNSVEVKAILALLDALCNPYNDIKMLSILRGSFVFSHFSDQELYDLRSKYPKQEIYKSLLQEEKYNDFLAIFHELQDHLLDKPSDLLELIYEKTKYPLMVSELYNSEQRIANLELLSNYMYDHNDLTIPEIIHDLNLKVELKSDISPAVVMDENANMVQFMTIHKSKGLEFPVVFVCNMNHGMNKEDVKQPLIIDGQNGIALKPRGIETIQNEAIGNMDVICEYINPYHKMLSLSVGKQSVSEEMRILYVALTRASQKLIMTGGADLEYLAKNYEDIQFANEFVKLDHYILPAAFRNRKSYLDWVILAYFAHPQIIDSFSYQDFNLHKLISRVPYLEEENIRNTKLYMEMYSQDEIVEAAGNYKIIHTKQEEKNYPILSMPKYDLVDSTIAVTKLVDEVPYERVYTNKRVLSATERGSLVHQFFEYFPFEDHDVSKVIEDYASKGLWDEIEVEELNRYKKHLQDFIDSEIFTFMKQSQRVLREKEFSYRMKSGTILHGTFDVLCINEGKITIIDYKTDTIASSESDQKLKEIHHSQMAYYKEIIQKMYPNYMVEAIVYYLEINRFVVL